MKSSLTKEITCQKKYDVEIIINKLERLQNDHFNRIKIPKFYYEIKENTVVYTSEFIKGVYAITPQQRTIVYEDVVLKDSDWTLFDYYYSNFIVENETEIIYAVDFQSYCHFPDINLRIDDWNYTDSEQKDFVKSLLFN
jgi:hypothetical protein